MFSLFRRSPKKQRTAAKSNRVKLRFESLEDRDCPSSITAFQATEAFNQVWTFTGQVVDPDPTPMVVRFDGLSSLSGLTANTNSDGRFSLTLQLPSGVNGTATAQTTDAAGVASNLATASVVDPSLSLSTFSSLTSIAAPSVSLSVSYGANQAVILSGQVVDSNSGGLIVNFSGAISGSAVTNSDGTFSFQSNSSNGGLVHAVTTNSSGVSSNTASATVAAAAPTITSFQATQNSDQTWTFTGQVSDRSTSGIQVGLGGLTSLASASVTTAADGSFSFRTALHSGEDGIATAQATDGVGATSNQATALATNTPNLTLSIAYGDQKTVILTGQVTDEHPGGMTINFTGSAIGSVVTNADGSFSVELQATSLGTIEATTSDQWGVISNTASVAVAPPPPDITGITVIRGLDNIWTFKGTLDSRFSGLTVSFDGLNSVQGKQETVQVNGGYCLIAQLQPDDSGTVTAVVTDWWGQQSNVACYVVRS